MLPSKANISPGRVKKNVRATLYSLYTVPQKAQPAPEEHRGLPTTEQSLVYSQEGRELGLAPGVGLRRPPDDTALVPAVAFHVEVAVVGNGEDVGGHLPYLLVGVLADVLWRVDGEQLVGVHSHQDGSRVCLQAARDRGLHCQAAGVGEGISTLCNSGVHRRGRNQEGLSLALGLAQGHSMKGGGASRRSLSPDCII